MKRRTVLFALVTRMTHGQVPVFSTDVSVVNILAVVHDRKGRVVTDFTKDDFVLEEQGRAQEIVYFSRQADLPLTLGVLIDASSSVTKMIDAERSACRRFLSRILRSDDVAFVIQFAGEVELLQDFTNSRTELFAALETVATPETLSSTARAPGTPTLGRGAPAGGTSLNDALLLASEELMQKRRGRKALILLSDGVDTTSRTDLETALKATHRADSAVYGIRFADPYLEFNLPQIHQDPNARLKIENGRQVLDRISDQTGGRLFEGRRSLDGAFDSIEQELRNQYSIGYKPDIRAAPGEFRRIRVTVRRKDCSVQARKGYLG